MPVACVCASGEVRIGGHDIRSQPRAARRQLGFCGFASQTGSDCLQKHLTGRQTLLLHAQLRGVQLGSEQDAERDQSLKDYVQRLLIQVRCPSA